MSTGPLYSMLQASKALTSGTLDLDLDTGAKIGGGTPTDNTTVLNALIASAAPGNPLKLLLDGASVATSVANLTNGGDITIEGTGWDSGLMLQAGTSSSFYAALLVFGPAVFTAPSTLPSNVILRDIQLNGNEANTTGQCINVGFNYIQGVTLENVWSVAARYFNTIFINCAHIAIDNCRFESIDTTIENTDGIHIDGPCEDLRITNCHFRTNDDAIALNAPEGYTGGNITNVVASNCTFDSCLSAGRIYGYGGNYQSENNQYYVSHVAYSNFSGSIVQYFGFQSAVLLLGATSGAGAVDTISDLTTTNFSFTCATNMVAVDQCVGTFVQDNWTWLTPTVANPWLTFGLGSVLISNWVISNCRIYRNTTGNSASFLVNAGGQTSCVIKRLEISGFAIVDEQGESYGQIPYLIDMLNLTITELVINSLDVTNIAALVNPTTGFTGIGTISGVGVLSTGFEIPDSIMANNCPYISQTSYPGKPCIKLAGTVYQFTIAS